MLLGIDQGTTGTRACLVGDDLTIARSAYAAHAQHTPGPGMIEHDAAEIWACTLRVMREVLATGTRPAAIAIANQGETVMLWNAKTGAPLHRALVWQDTRTEGALGALAGSRERIADLTGLRLDSYFSASKLAWLLDHADGARALAAAGQLRAGTLDTWLIDRLTGGKVFATDASTAARTLLCDTRDCTWSDELCALFGVPRGILPEIHDTDAGFGDYEGIPIVASLVDQPAAMMGQGCVDRGDIKATFGTGCFVYANTGTVRPDRPGGTLGTVAWRRRGATTYALDGGVLAFGTAVDWLKGLPLHVDDRALAATTDVACVPALVGLGAPHWDRLARGAWLGLSAATSREDLVAAAAEGLCCRVVEVVRAIERDSGIAVGMLRADGGLARSQALMQRVADLLGAPVEIAEEEEESTAVGACAMAALRIGRISMDTIRTRRTRGQARLEPRITADERGTRLDRFDRAVGLARQWR